MLESIKLNKLLVIDIETVSQHKSMSELDEDWQELWSKKAGYITKDKQQPSEVYDRAAIYAEFGKIVCIGVGAFVVDNQGVKLRLKAFSGDDERELLRDFSSLLNEKFNTKDHLLVAHNGKEFDYPYFCRRMLINGLPLPSILNISGKKPWEVNLLDTLELWKFGDYKHYTSLNVLAKCFGIPSPKEDLDGSLVGHTYWVENDLNRISTYCLKDVTTTAQLLLRFLGKPLMLENQVETA